MLIQAVTGYAEDRKKRKQERVFISQTSLIMLWEEGEIKTQYVGTHVAENFSLTTAAAAALATHVT